MHVEPRQRKDNIRILILLINYGLQDVVESTIDITPTQRPKLPHHLAQTHPNMQ